MWFHIFILVVTLVFLWKILKKPDNYPPGFWGLPLIGYIPIFQRKNAEELITDMLKKHDKVICWRFGTKLIVFINDLKLVKEAFLGMNFVDRARMRLFGLLDGVDGKLGLTKSNGIHWQNGRRFTLRHLRDLGMGKSKLVEAVHLEAKELTNEFKKLAGKPSQIPNCLTIAVLNVLWHMVSGRRYAMDDKELLEFEAIVMEIQLVITRLGLADCMPWIEKILPKFLFNLISKEDKRLEMSARLYQLLQTYISEHKANLDPNDPKDYIDAYLIEMEKNKDDPESTFSEKDLTYCIADLFFAGSETTTSTLYWSIFYLATWPEVQTRLQKEIDEVVPKGTTVTLEHKPKLPYTEAFMHEVLRFSSLASTGVPHTNFVDVKLGDYLIPKNSLVVPAIYWIHFNPDYYESPEKFMPERFLDSAGKFVNPKEAFLPFGIGRRQCLGESLARMEYFIFLVTLVQHLHFAAPEGKTIDLAPIGVPVGHLANINQQVLWTLRNDE